MSCTPDQIEYEPHPTKDVACPECGGRDTRHRKRPCEYCGGSGRLTACMLCEEYMENCECDKRMPPGMD